MKAKQIEVDRNIAHLCEQGYHFCLTCERVTLVLDDGRCEICKSGRVQFFPKIFSGLESESRSESRSESKSESKSESPEPV